MPANTLEGTSAGIQKKLTTSQQTAKK